MHTNKIKHASSVYYIQFVLVICTYILYLKVSNTIYNSGLNIALYAVC